MKQEAWNALTSAEAEKRHKAGQVNRLPHGNDSLWPIFRRHLFTLFNLLNLIMAAALISVNSYRNLMFLGVVIGNALIGIVQEIRAKKQHDALTLLAQSPIAVLRDGIWQNLPPAELVLDDVVRLSRGEQIPADAIVLDGLCSVDESLLTGESAAIQKYERDSLYGGTFLISGTVVARLTAVGANSCAGRMQLEAKKIKPAQSKLMKDLRTVIRVVGTIVIPLGIALYLITLARGSSNTRAVQGSVAAVLGMIPEGLMLLTSVSLTAGVIKLGRQSTLVNVLYGIEGLARTEVLCIDKTGTLTSGQMTAEALLPLGTADEAEARSLLGAVCAALTDSSPTNNALLHFWGDAPLPRLTDSIPFSSEQQWSAAKTESGWALLGAPERLLKGEALEKARSLAAEGLRVLALGSAPDGITPDAKACRPAAILTLRDSLRPNVEQTVSYFEKQGVTLKVISGDSAATVSQIAKAAGIRDAGKAVDMSSLPRPLNYSALAAEYTVFGRTAPEEKQHLVEAFRQSGRFTAMLGDGVNDIPALKAADCAIAMAGGSDAASRVAQIDLLDGDFSRLPQVVDEGRRVINNITRAASLFLLKNIFSLICTIALLLMPYEYPFAPIQLTLISTLTIGAPSFVLALEPNHDRVRGNFLVNVISRALPGGLCAALLILLTIILGHRAGLDHAHISTLCTLITGASGLAALILICLPLNALRAGLLAVISAAFTAAVLFAPSLFLLVPPPPAFWAIAAGTIPVSVGIQILLGACVRKLAAVLANKGKISYTIEHESEQEKP